MSGKTLSVFIADDEKIIRIGAKKLLEALGEDIVICGEAENGRDALPLIHRLNPDLVITDLKMPFVGGIELSKAVKQDLPDTEIIVMTGYDEFDYARDALRAGVFDFLLKPVSSEELRKSITRLKAKLAGEKAPSSAEKSADSEAERSDLLVEKIKRYLEANYSRSITLKTLEETFFFNASYISRIFKQQVGVNYSDYLLNIRIGRAKELLRTTNRSIDYISETVGFGNSKYFSRIFKEMTGIQPIQYRKTATEENNEKP